MPRGTGIRDASGAHRSGMGSFSLSARQRIHHLTGLTRADYLSLIAVVNIVIDCGGGTERSMLPALETMMIGTPLVTLHPKEEVRGWDNVQPISSVAALLREIGAWQNSKDVVNLVQLCVASNEREYIDKISTLLKDAALQKTIQSVFRTKTTTWLAHQNRIVQQHWLSFVERIGRPFKQWREEMHSQQL